MLHNIEALKAAHAESLREAEEANRIALALPVVPKRVGFALKHTPWVHYEVDTLTEALEIFKQYTPTPYVIARDGSFTVISTLAALEDTNRNKRNQYRVDSETDGAPYFDCMMGVGYQSVGMKFFTNAAGRDLKIDVRIANSPIQVRLICLDQYSRSSGKKYRKAYPSVPGASVLQWGYGEDCCKGTYWFRDLDTFWASMTTFGWNG